MPTIVNSDTPDVVLIGAGIMSATFGTFLKELEPSLTVAMFESLDDCARESSEGWSNAGTGHAANCELNYTPQRKDGSVDISKALEVNTEFDLSRKLWSYLVKKGAISDPRAFINPCPHQRRTRCARGAARHDHGWADRRSHRSYAIESVALILMPPRDRED